MVLTALCVCGQQASCKDLFGEPLCQTCCDRFNARPHPRAMTKQERIKEVSFILTHFTQYKIQNADKYRRLSELTGKRIHMYSDTNDLLDEMKNEEDEDCSEWESWLDDADGYRQRSWTKRPLKHLRLLEADELKEKTNENNDDVGDDWAAGLFKTDDDSEWGFSI